MTVAPGSPWTKQQQLPGTSHHTSLYHLLLRTSMNEFGARCAVAKCLSTGGCSPLPRMSSPPPPRRRQAYSASAVPPAAASDSDIVLVPVAPAGNTQGLRVATASENTVAARGGGGGGGGEAVPSPRAGRPIRRPTWAATGIWRGKRCPPQLSGPTERVGPGAPGPAHHSRRLCADGASLCSAPEVLLFLFWRKGSLEAGAGLKQGFGAP